MSTLIDLNPIDPIDLNPIYPCMISSDKFSRSYNILSPKICVPKETKNINVKILNMITNKNKAEAMTERILCDCTSKFNNAICNSDQK